VYYHNIFTFCPYIPVVIHFWIPTKNNTKTNIKKYSEEIQKIIAASKGCWNAHKIARNWLRRFKNTKIEI
jgi:hypothetical protein